MALLRVGVVNSAKLKAAVFSIYQEDSGRAGSESTFDEVRPRYFHKAGTVGPHREYARVLRTRTDLRHR